ncbi:hypothetical protein RhiTH_002975 [Rhizoctonia solani]
MGQDISHSQYPPDETLQPGTYRISNAVTGTAVQVSDDDSTKIVTWQQHDRENQQIHIWNLDGGNMPHRIWRVERIGDDFGEETTDSRQEQSVGNSTAKNEPTNKGLPETQEEIISNSELSQLRGELSKAKQELSDLHSLLYQRDETIRQLQQDLKAKEEALKHARKTDEESTQLRHQHSILESKFQQQQTETASLQAKMDRVEYLMTQIHIPLRGTGSFKYWDFEYLEDDTKRMTLEQFGTNAKEEEYKQEVAYLQKELKCASKQVIACGTEL